MANSKKFINSQTTSSNKNNNNVIKYPNRDNIITKPEIALYNINKTPPTESRAVKNQIIDKITFSTITGIIITVFLTCAILLTSPAIAQYPYPSKVDIKFDDYHDNQEINSLLRKLVEAYPKLLSIQTIGKSIAGEEMLLVTLNNPETGPDISKAAMFIDGNIHGNEMQAAETVLYSIWYLTKSYGKIESLTKLMDERSFYFLPLENPDGRNVWFHEPATPHYLRGGLKPTDNDHDGLYDEDPPDDINGDGSISTMWREDPLGRYKRDPKDDRFFIRVEQDEEPGGWTRAGQEGYDNDGDGEINEDGPGGYDPNRNWPSDWQPNHVQYGADDYPFSLPETRAIGDFIKAHPNIAAYQSYHNNGGMILSGPSADYVRYPREDEMVFRQLQNTGVELLPFYKAYVTYKDLYTVHGGETSWVFEGLGIYSFTNELWTDDRMYMTSERLTSEQERKFQDMLQFGDIFVPYKEFDHPTYGKVLIGGTTKYSSRVTPPWMLEEGCHRNFAFTMFHADQMPKVEWGLLQILPLKNSNNLWEVTVEVKNPKIIPSIAAIARSNNIGARDYLLCQSTNNSPITVATSGTVSQLKYAKINNPTEHQPERIWNNSGIRGKDNQLFRYIIQANPGTKIDLEYYSQKGGTINQTIELKETIPPIPDNPTQKKK